MNWYKNSSSEKWIFNILEQMLKASDIHDIKSLFKWAGILKKYIQTINPSSEDESINSFINFCKNKLLSNTDDAHEKINQISGILLGYLVLKDKLKG